MCIPPYAIVAQDTREILAICLILWLDKDTKTYANMQRDIKIRNGWSYMERKQWLSTMCYDNSKQPRKIKWLK